MFEIYSAVKCKYNVWLQTVIIFVVLKKHCKLTLVALKRLSQFAIKCYGWMSKVWYSNELIPSCCACFFAGNEFRANRTFHTVFKCHSWVAILPKQIFPAKHRNVQF